MEEDVRDVRRQNLRRIAEAFKTQALFAAAADIAESFASQIFNGQREVGEKLARRIEQSLGLAQGELDVDALSRGTFVRDNAGEYLVPESAAPKLPQKPRSAGKNTPAFILRLQAAWESGALTQADLDLLEQIAHRLVKSGPRRKRKNIS